MLAFYINLDRRTDRRAFMEAQAAALGMAIERLDATTPDTIDAAELAPLSMREIGKRLTPTEVAISISHFRAWRHMLDCGLRHVLVLEDDLRLSLRLPAFLAAMEADGKDAGILRLETHLDEVKIHPKAEPGPLGHTLHLPLSFESGAGAYVISATSAKKILASPKRFSLPLDDILFSLDSPFRDRSALRVAVPALALYRFEVSEQFDVPQSILASDAQMHREMHSAHAALNKPTDIATRAGREIARLARQIARAYPALWIKLFARTTVIPFADGEDGSLDASEPRSGARLPA